jgi:hypothetical protein
VLDVRERSSLTDCEDSSPGFGEDVSLLLAGHLSLNVESLKPSFPLPGSTEGSYLPSRIHWFSTIENCIFSPEGTPSFCLMQRCFMSFVVLCMKGSMLQAMVMLTGKWEQGYGLHLSPKPNDRRDRYPDYILAVTG